MIPLAFADTLVIWRRGAASDLGDFPAAAVSSTVTGAFWPTTTAELINSQDTVSWDATAVLPPEADILPTDQIEVRGVLYNVNGNPTFWKSNLTGHEVGWQVLLNTATG